MRSHVLAVAIGIALILPVASASLGGSIAAGLQGLEPPANEADHHRDGPSLEPTAVDVTTAPAPAAAAAPAAPAPAGHRTPDEVLDFVLATPFGDMDSPGLRGLTTLKQQPQPPNGTQNPNGTNGTILDGNHTGRHTHTHPGGGDNGLGAVWAAPFYGSPRHIVLLDVDGDGQADPVTGTDIGVVAMSAHTGEVLWAYLIGNEVTSLFLVDVDGDDVMEVGFSTLWQAQLPRVGVIGIDGRLQWEMIGEQPFLAAGPSDGAIIAIDLSGHHHRFDGRTGALDWSADAEVLQDDPPMDLVYQNIGHYLAAFGDLNGDGVADSVSAGLYHYGAPFVVDNVFTIIHALDGRTGDRLWIHPIGPEPPVLGVATHVLSDLDVLDARGDGSLDVSYSGQSYRWPLLWTALVISLGALVFMHYETYVRAVDGSSDDLAEPLGGRTLVTPVLPIERYLDIDHTDIDGDGKDEVAVVRASVVDSLLNEAVSQLEFYRLLPSQATAPTDFVLSPTTYIFNATARLHGGPTAQGRALVASVQGDATGELVIVAPDMALLARVPTPSVPWTAAVLDGAVASGQDGRLEVRDLQAAMPAAVTAVALLRSTPIDFAAGDRDGDGFADVYVLSSDGTIHVVDAITGGFMQSIDLGVAAQRLWVMQATDDDVPDLLVLRSGGATSPGTMELWDGQRLSVRWSVPTNLDEPVWFQGDDDGVPDFLASIDRYEDTATAVNGVTGHTLWTADVVGGFWQSGAFMVDHTPGIGQDVVVWDRQQGFQALNGSNGKVLWTHDPSGSVQSVCGATFDDDGDGVGEALVLYREGFTYHQLAINVTGGTRSVAVLPQDTYNASCTTHQADGSLLLEAVVTTQAGGSLQGTLRYDGSIVWSTLSSSFISQFGVQHVLGVDAEGGRVVYGREDHVYSLDWEDGSVVGEFVVNGPFVEGGVLLDIDGSAPLEALAYTGDGILWLLAEDANGLATFLDKQAQAQGKKPMDASDDLPSDGKKSPGMGWLLPLGAALWARRRLVEQGQASQK